MSAVIRPANHLMQRRGGDTMFTGIVQAVGVVRGVQTTTTDGCRLTIDWRWKYESDRYLDFEEGDSIAVNGVCLTVNAKHKTDGYDDYTASFDISPETQARCLIGEWREGTRVNIERSVTMETPLGGHLVTGHIDGIGTVLYHKTDGQFTRLDIETTSDIGRLIARKGSIAVDGVSLTVNEVIDDSCRTRFSVMLVPHTLQATTMDEICLGSRSHAHLEVDSVARYVQRLLETDDKTLWAWRRRL